MDLLNRLNPKQQEAVMHMEGPLLILAGAGSGKTRVLTHRIAYLVENGVKPFNILALTFTNKAAKEMRERVNGLIPQGESCWVSTFHSMCVRILRREIDKILYSNQFTIYDSDDSERLIKAALKELNISDKQYPVRSCMSAISGWKNELLTPEAVERAAWLDFRQVQICKVYKVYQKKLRDSNALDFDDIIFKTVELFTAREDVARKYQERFRYIMVDEYQDTNASQYRLIQILSGLHKNLCVVGDDDQSIYGWRGADIRNILEFEKDFRNTKVIRLEQNYRSTKIILDTANAVIKNNEGRKAKTLWTENSQGTPISFFRAPSDMEEGIYVADKISYAVSNGAEYKHFAVLYRNNAQSRAIEDQFVKKSIPYRLLGGIRFYERREVKDILAYLRFIYNPQDLLALTRIINVPRRGIGDASIDKIINYSNERDISFFESLNELEDIPGLGSRVKKIAEFRDLIKSLIIYSIENSVLDLINKVIEDTGYIIELKAEGTEESEGRIENIMELVSKAAEFAENSEDKGLAAFLEDVALVADIDSYEEQDNAVVLMTLHSSKGLEFPNVFLIGFEDGLFPSYRSITSGDIADLEEERRLCYVGITRAMENLYIVAATSRMQYGQTNYNPISRFFKEIPSGLMDVEQTVVKPKERKGVSQFAEIAKAKSSIDISFGAKNYNTNLPAPKNVDLDFTVGDSVRQMRYGVGKVVDICSAGADYEVSVMFEDGSIKKFMAHLSKLKKI